MRRVMIMLVLSLGVLTGCLAGCRAGESTEGAPASRPARPDPRQLRYETLIGDCMTERGFSYVPHPAVTPADSAEARYSGWRSVLQPDAEVRAFRQKYGFGLYARLVYPDDPALAPGSAPDADRAADPNLTIRDALDPARRQAYDLARQGCGGAAGARVYPSRAAGERDYEAFRGDPAVAAAAGRYAGCLRDRGHPIDRTEPGTIETSVYRQATEAFGGADLFNPDAAEQLGTAAARRGLTREIDQALADLDCRTGYADLARTRYPEVIAALHGP